MNVITSFRLVGFNEKGEPLWSGETGIDLWETEPYHTWQKEHGCSAACIRAFMEGVLTPTTGSFNVSWPWDRDDFGRCYRLLQQWPQWKSRMPEMATLHPSWEFLAQNWSELDANFDPNWRNQNQPNKNPALDVLLQAGHVKHAFLSQSFLLSFPDALVLMIAQYSSDIGYWNDTG